jgi:hypothetical protein
MADYYIFLKPFNGGIYEGAKYFNTTKEGERPSKEGTKS